MEASEQLYNVIVKTKGGENAGKKLTEGLHRGFSPENAAFQLLAERINTGVGVFITEDGFQQIPIVPEMQVSVEIERVDTDTNEQNEKTILDWTLEQFFPKQEQPEKS